MKGRIQTKWRVDLIKVKIGSDQDKRPHMPAITGLLTVVEMGKNARANASKRQKTPAFKHSGSAS